MPSSQPKIEMNMQDAAPSITPISGVTSAAVEAMSTVASSFTHPSRMLDVSASRLSESKWKTLTSPGNILDKQTIAPPSNTSMALNRRLSSNDLKVPASTS